jgi:glycerol-3-phosphate dehydrogenase
MASFEDADSEIPDRVLGDFIERVNNATPALQLNESSISTVLAGYLPVVRDSDAELTKRPYVFDHSSIGVDGLVTVWGIKYTTARSVSNALIGRLFPNSRRIDAAVTR